MISYCKSNSLFLFWYLISLFTNDKWLSLWLVNWPFKLFDRSNDWLTVGQVKVSNYQPFQWLPMFKISFQWNSSSHSLLTGREAKISKHFDITEIFTWSVANMLISFFKCIFTSEAVMKDIMFPYKLFHFKNLHHTLQPVLPGLKNSNSKKGSKFSQI